MFYTVASILITVVTLLFGVGYIVYKKIIQMIKNLDEKYECRLQIKLSEINTKFNETITEMESRIKSLENTTRHNLEHTETLMIDLNNKNMITRNMLYDVKKEFARTTREYTTHYTNTSKDIKLLENANAKFNETISVVESRIQSLENTRERNLEDTETLITKVNHNFSYILILMRYIKISPYTLNKLNENINRYDEPNDTKNIIMLLE